MNLANEDESGAEVLIHPVNVISNHLVHEVTDIYPDSLRNGLRSVNLTSEDESESFYFYLQD